MKVLKIIGIIAIMLVGTIFTLFQKMGKMEKKEQLKEQYLNGEFDPGYAELSDIEKEFVRTTNLTNRKCPIKAENSRLIHIEYKPSPIAEFLYVHQLDSGVIIDSDISVLKSMMCKAIKNKISPKDKNLMVSKNISFHYIYINHVGDTLQNFKITPKDFN